MCVCMGGGGGTNCLGLQETPMAGVSRIKPLFLVLPDLKEQNGEKMSQITLRLGCVTLKSLLHSLPARQDEGQFWEVRRLL